MTLYAQKANIVTCIQESQIDDFIAKGYRVIDETGRIVKDTAPDNLETLKAAYVSNTAEINSLKAEVARLKDELTRAQKILDDKKAEPKATAVAKTEEPSANKPRQARARRT